MKTVGKLEAVGPFRLLEKKFLSQKKNAEDPKASQKIDSGFYGCHAKKRMKKNSHTSTSEKLRFLTSSEKRS